MAVEIGVAIAAAITATAGVTIPAGLATFFGHVVISGTLLGAQLLMNRFLTDQAGAPVESISDARHSVRQARPAQRMIYGELIAGGAVFFLERKGDWLYIGLLVANHEIDRVGATLVNGQQVSFDSNGAAVAAPYRDGSTVYLYRSVRTGTESQAIDPILAADFPAAGANIVTGPVGTEMIARITNLPTSFRQRGHATIVYKAKFYNLTQTLFEAIWGKQGNFNPLALVRGKKLYDPRRASHVLGAPSTYEWSDCAALCQADYLTSSHGGRISSGLIDWTALGRQADKDDGLVGYAAGGFFKRHTINGVVTLDRSPLDVIESMLTANRGFLIQNRGRVTIKSTFQEEPVTTLHEGLLIGGFEFRGDAPRKALRNRVRTRFVATDRDYQLVDGPMIESAEYIADDGQDLEVSIALPYTVDAARAQMLAKPYFERSRGGRALTLPCSLAALIAPGKPEGLEAGDLVRVWFKNFSQVNGIYQVTSIAIRDGLGGVDLQLAEDTPRADIWVPSVDEQPFTIAVAEAA